MWPVQNTKTYSAAVATPILLLLAFETFYYLPADQNRLVTFDSGLRGCESDSGPSCLAVGVELLERRRPPSSAIGKLILHKDERELAIAYIRKACSLKVEEACERMKTLK